MGRERWGGRGGAGEVGRERWGGKDGAATMGRGPESITQSAPSMTALATSEHSARVGRGLTIIDSSICVATTQGLPAMRHFVIIIFC